MSARRRTVSFKEEESSKVGGGEKEEEGGGNSGGEEDEDSIQQGEEEEEEEEEEEDGDVAKSEDEGAGEDGDNNNNAGSAPSSAPERKMSLMNFEMDDEVRDVLSFDALKKAANELATFPRVVGPAATLLTRGIEEHRAGQHQRAVHTYLRALREAEGGKEQYLVLVTLLNAGECSMHITDNPTLKEKGETLLRRALDLIDQSPGPQVRAACHEYIVDAARCWWAAELALPEKTTRRGSKKKKKTTKKKKKKTGAKGKGKKKSGSTKRKKK